MADNNERVTRKEKKRSKSRPPRSKSQGPPRKRGKPNVPKTKPWHNKVKVGGSNSDLVLAKTDARFAADVKMDYSLSNQLQTITINKNLSTLSLFWSCAGYLSRAFERGFAGFAANNYTPFYALQFMSNILANYSQAQVIPVTQLPYWLLCLGHAISPKSAKFGEAGEVNYQFSIGSALPFVPTPNQGIGYGGYGFTWSAGWDGGTRDPGSGWPIIATSGSSYTDALGAAAFQQLCQFMTDKGDDNEKTLSRLVPSTDFTPFKKDVSAFALFLLAEGTGSSGEGGGIYGQLQLEVPVRHPILALFSCAQDTFVVKPPTRNFNLALTVAGDPCFLGAMMSTAITSKQLATQRNHRLKPVNFLEFAEVMAMWVQGIIQAYYNDTAETLTATVATNVICPLSLQEMMLCLRNTIMGGFKSSQSAVQGIYPFVPSSSGDNQFVPYVSAVGTCPINTLDMQLPVPLIENVKALAGRLVKYKVDTVHIMPILGQYSADLLSSSDYQVTYTIPGGTATTVNAFATGPFMFKEEVDTKGNTTRTALVEPQISLVDGSYTSGLLMINDPENLKRLITIWNQWLTSTGVQTYSVQTGTMSTEPGINVLCSIAMTRIWANLSLFNIKGEKRERKRSSSVDNFRIVDVRGMMANRKAMLTSPFAGKKVIIDTSQGKMISAAYEQVLATWILPTDDDEVIAGANSTVTQRWQFIMCEPYSQPRTSGESGITLSALHLAYASKMLKGKFANQDDWTVFFSECAKLGRGGILSGIVADLVSSFFPAAAPIAKGIAGMIPI